jgi:hypothetical protein
MCQKCFCLFKMYLNRKCVIVHLNEFLVGKIYVLRIRALISLYETNTDKCTHILLDHNFINTVRNSNMFRPQKGHLQEV